MGKDGPAIRTGGKFDYFEESIKQHDAGRVLGVAVEEYEKKSYTGIMGMAFKNVGFQMSNKAAGILKDRVSSEHEAVFAAQAKKLEMEAAARKEAETAAIAEAAEASAGEADAEAAP